jgi:hypothetical protein
LLFVAASASRLVDPRRGFLLLRLAGENKRVRVAGPLSIPKAEFLNRRGPVRGARRAPRGSPAFPEMERRVVELSIGVATTAGHIPTGPAS